MADRGSKSQLSVPQGVGEAASGSSADSYQSVADAVRFPWQRDVHPAEPDTVVRLPQSEPVIPDLASHAAGTSRSKSSENRIPSGLVSESGLPADGGELSGTRTINADSYLLKRLFPNSTENNFSPDQQQFEGMSLGHFQLLSRLGVGGMGSVFLAEDEILRRQVALKILAPSQSRDESSVARFQNEARAAASLDHPHVARVFSSGEDRGLHYIAYEYVEGHNLRDRIRQTGRIDPAEAVYYTIQLAEALVHLSAMNVVHRDIKPSNILISRHGRVKLVDLGLARCQLSDESVELTVAGTTLGTFDYISPEQAKDPRTVDVRSDIYSLGCTLYHMLTGEPPYPEGTVLQKLLDHQGRESPDPAVKNRLVSPSLSMLVRKMMASDRRKRYSSAEELLGDLTILARQMGIPTTGVMVMAPPRNRLQDGIRQNIGWLATVALLVMVVVLLDRFPQIFPARKESRNDSSLVVAPMQAITPSQAGTAPITPLERRPFPDTRSPRLAPSVAAGETTPVFPNQGQAADGSSSSRNSLPPDRLPQDSNLSLPANSLATASSIPSKMIGNSTTAQDRQLVPPPVDMAAEFGTNSGLPLGASESPRVPTDRYSPGAGVPSPQARTNSDGPISSDLAGIGKVTVSPNSNNKSPKSVNPISPLLIPFDDSLAPSNWLENIFSTKPSTGTAPVPSGTAVSNSVAGSSGASPGGRINIPESSTPRTTEGISETGLATGNTLEPAVSSGSSPSAMNPTITELPGSTDRTLNDRSTVNPGALTAAVRIVDGKSFDSLEAACVSAKPGDVIELRYQGRLLPSEKPIRLSGKSLTIRAAKGFRPVVRFAPQDSLQSSMVTMTGGALALVNVDFEWDLPETVTADLWSLFSTQRIDKLSLQNVRITVRNPRQSPATVLRQSAPAGQAPTIISSMKSGVGAASTPETTISNCLIRGTSRFCTLDDPSPARYVVENSIIAVDDDVFRSMGLMDVMAEADRVEINFNHVTAVTRQHFLKLGSGDDFSVSLTPLSVSIRNSIMAVGQGKSLILQQGMAGETDLRRFLSWSGERNFYDAIEPIWQTSSAAYKMKFDKWKQFWSVGGELSSSQNIAIEWRGRWMLKPFDTMIPEDVELDDTSDSNPLLNAATDGTDVGVAWRTLSNETTPEHP